MIWDYPEPPEYNEPRPPRDEDEILQEVRDRRLEESYEQRI